MGLRSLDRFLLTFCPADVIRRLQPPEPLQGHTDFGYSCEVTGNMLVVGSREAPFTDNAAQPVEEVVSHRTRAVAHRHRLIHSLPLCRERWL